MATARSASCACLAFFVNTKTKVKTKTFRAASNAANQNAYMPPTAIKMEQKQILQKSVNDCNKQLVVCPLHFEK